MHAFIYKRDSIPQFSLNKSTWYLEKQTTEKKKRYDSI